MAQFLTKQGGPSLQVANDVAFLKLKFCVMSVYAATILTSQQCHSKYSFYHVKERC